MRSNKEDFNEQKTIEDTKTEKKIMTRPKKYIITVTNLALREGPGTDYEKIGIADSGVTLISEIENDYGKLADGSGWVSMNYVRKAD